MGTEIYKTLLEDLNKGEEVALITKYNLETKKVEKNIYHPAGCLPACYGGTGSRIVWLCTLYGNKNHGKPDQDFWRGCIRTQCGRDGRDAGR